MAEIDKSLTADEIASVILALNNGARIADVCGATPEMLEGLYGLAYNLYGAASYKDAETVFKALCLYDHKDVRFWMGLGGCRQALGDYANAIEAYTMAGMAQQLSSPEPFLHAVRCYLELGDRENAISGLRGVLELGDPAVPAHAECHAKARALLELLEKQA